MSTSVGSAALGAFSLLLAGAASGATTRFTGVLTSLEVSPPNFSSASGSAVITLSLALHQLTVEMSFTGLAGTATAGNLHCCAESPTNVGLAMTNFPDFPVGTSSGTYSRTFDTSDPTTYTGTFLNNNGGTASSAEAALASGLAARRAYVDVHSAVYPAGEIRAYPLPENLSFFTLAPCRLLDTRAGGTAMAAQEPRLVSLNVNGCGVPITARALSVNVTVANAAATGFLVLYPAALPTVPDVSTLSFGAGNSRANNASVALSADGQRALVVRNSSSGTVDVIIDVNGYFAAAP